jgi:hypothetical protein
MYSLDQKRSTYPHRTHGESKTKIWLLFKSKYSRDNFIGCFSVTSRWRCIMHNTEYRISQTKDRQPMAIHSRGQQETVSRMISVEPNSRSRVTSPRANHLPQTLHCLSVSLLPHLAIILRSFSVFISPLYFSAVNQKHHNKIICYHCTVRGKNPVKASVLTVNSAVTLLIWKQLLLSIFFFQGLLEKS